MSRIQDRTDAIKALIESQSYTNVEVVDYVNARGSYKIKQEQRELQRGNSVIAVKFMSRKPGKNNFTEQEHFRIEVYSYHRNTEKANDIELLFDSVWDVLWKNKYTVKDGAITFAPFVKDDWYMGIIDCYKELKKG